MKTVAYLRVSTRSQDLANQKLAILEFSKKRRFTLAEFSSQAQRVIRGQWPPQIGKLGCRRPCPFSTILANMTEDERQYLFRTVAETHSRLSEVALKLLLELPPKAPR